MTHLTQAQCTKARFQPRYNWPHSPCFRVVYKMPPTHCLEPKAVKFQRMEQSLQVVEKQSWRFLGGGDLVGWIGREDLLDWTSSVHKGRRQARAGPPGMLSGNTHVIPCTSTHGLVHSIPGGAKEPLPVSWDGILRFYIYGPWTQTAWVQSLTVPLTSCVSLSKLLNHSLPQFIQL